MDWYSNYLRWKADKAIKDELSIQLKSLTTKDKIDCFYKNLEFGTGGIRGELGPGTNRINIYTIRKAAEGVARYIEMKGEKAKAQGVVIAYDSRYKSTEFAIEAAKTIGQHGIKIYLFESLRSTPELSFAVRHLNAFNGIVITASHNPPEYNGFKVYGQDGAQIGPLMAEEIITKVNEVEDELTVAVAEEESLKEKGLLTLIGSEVDREYLIQLEKVTLNKNLISKMEDVLKIIYTPLHGTGNLPVRNGLLAAGFKNVQVVKEQEMPDSNFSTVASPNPEEHEVFELAIKYGEQMDADILMGTDPDTDRVGVAAKNHDGKFQILSGNQVGALLLNYLIIQKKELGTLKETDTVLKTIVTSEIGRAIAKSHNLKTIDTLTGFKYIGEKINEFEVSKPNTFLFGYEESYGYLISDFVRDKDAIQSCVLIAEVAAYYKFFGMTLYEGLQQLFEEYGYYQESLKSLTLKGKDGIEQINRMLTLFRDTPPTEFAGIKVTIIEDYLLSVRTNTQKGTKETIHLPRSNVIKFKMENDSWFCLRPSGTEPKIKLYFGVKDSTLEKSKTAIEELENDVMNKIST
ncbi:phospho-sugar mutase [Planomicrobium okeanokoites]|uniref:phospho-sugar mutase n=1 Tax=Planomicrobium okeanokoites TaxID=244 RepID=UPI0024935F5B|nr:phospho-sugar mutase [Planomicrobium okeanokoites]